MPTKGVRPRTRRSDVGKVDEQEKSLELYLAGYSQMQIADQMGVSQTTVYHRLQEAAKRRTDPLVDEWRRTEGARLEFERGEIRKIARDQSDPELKLKAYDRVLRYSDRLAKLYGADLPVKTEVTVVEITEAERELQEILNEAAAAQANKEQELLSEGARRPRARR